MHELRGRMDKISDLLWLYGQAFVFSIWVHLVPIYPALLSLFILIGIDTVTGIWASLKTGRSFISGRAWRIFSKIFVMTLVMKAAYEFQSLGKGIWEFSAVSAVGLAFAVVELISILENAGLILGQPMFAWLIKKLDSKNINKPKGE